MPNFKSVVHFLLVDFGGGYLLTYLLTYLLVVVTGGKQRQLLVHLTWTGLDFDKMSN